MAMSARTSLKIVALVVMCSAIVLVIICMVLKSLFITTIRNPNQGKFSSVVVWFGLFQSFIAANFQHNDVMEIWDLNVLSHEKTWQAAQAMSILALIAGVVTSIQHSLSFRFLYLRRWYFIVLELTFLLSAVISLVICCALVETQMEQYSNDFVLGILVSKKIIPDGAGSITTLDGPSKTYWIVVAADFAFLLALLFVIPEFIMVCEDDERRKKEAKHASEIAALRRS